MSKTLPCPVQQENDSPAKAVSPKAKKKGAGRKAYVTLDRTEIAKKIQQLRDEVESHLSCAAALEATLEKLTGAACTEDFLPKQLRDITRIMKKYEAKDETQAPVSESPPSRDAPSLRNDQTEVWKKDLDRALEKLQNVKKMIEESRLTDSQKDELPVRETAGKKAKKILVVDDDRTTVNIITHFLERENYAVSSSLAGVEGLKKAFKEIPDLILLDILMSDLNGFQFLSILRKDEECSHVPVIIISSLSEEADVLRGLNIGAADYITKPFSPQVLMTKVKKNLNSRS
jgi:PleD family two-component response regulator